MCNYDIPIAVKFCIFVYIIAIIFINSNFVEKLTASNL